MSKVLTGGIPLTVNGFINKLKAVSRKGMSKPVVIKVQGKPYVEGTPLKDFKLAVVEYPTLVQVEFTEQA